MAAACLPLPPPEPSPQRTAESEAEFAARRAKWYGDIAEQAMKASLPKRAADEDRLWATAQRVVLARITKVRSTRLRGSEGQWYESPLVTLRPIKWVKGQSSAERLKIHLLSDDSCDGGAGDAPDGDVGEIFLLFYRPGALGPRDVLDTLDQGSAVTTRSREAFRLLDRQ